MNFTQLNDAIGGQIDGVCDTATSLSTTIAAGSLKGLAVSAAARLATLPDVPTAAEAGLPAFQAQGWNALFAPKGTPEPVIARLNAALRTALASPALQQRFADLSSILPAASEASPGFVATLVPGEIEKYRVLLQAK